MRQNFNKVGELVEKFQNGIASIGDRVKVVGTVYMVRKRKGYTLIWISDTLTSTAIVKICHNDTTLTVKAGDKVWVSGTLKDEPTYGMICYMESDYLQTNVY